MPIWVSQRRFWYPNADFSIQTPIAVVVHVENGDALVVEDACVVKDLSCRGVPCGEKKQKEIPGTGVTTSLVRTSTNIWCAYAVALVKFPLTTSGLPSQIWTD